MKGDKMPNWCDNYLSITGPQESLDELVEQMKQPYQVITQDWKTKEIQESTREGEFLMWNIIRPIDTDSYFGLAEMKAEQDKLVLAQLDPDPAVADPKLEAEQLGQALAEKLTNFDVGSVIEQFHADIATKEDWYHWNIRNWGTKWELSDADVSRNSPTNLTVTYQTAWSPAVEAVDKLAQQYPMLTFFTRAIEEGMDFAFELTWENGERGDEIDLEINHDLKMSIWGECECEWDEDLDEERRAELGCPPKEVE